MPDTAGREEEEGGPNADALFIKKLQKKKEKSQVIAALSTRPKDRNNLSVHQWMEG
jgi:hypothetical protein